MRTCWVLDHPAHVRLLAPFLRCSNNNDVIIATKRKEVEQMIEHGDGHIPRRQIHWVERPVGVTKNVERRWKDGGQATDFWHNVAKLGNPYRGLWW